MRARNQVTTIILRVFFALAATALTASAQPYLYVSNEMGNNVAVVNTATNTIKASISITGAGLTT